MLLEVIVFRFVDFNWFFRLNGAALFKDYLWIITARVHLNLQKSEDRRSNRFKVNFPPQTVTITIGKALKPTPLTCNRSKFLKLFEKTFVDRIFSVCCLIFFNYLSILVIEIVVSGDVMRKNCYVTRKYIYYIQLKNSVLRLLKEEKLKICYNLFIEFNFLNFFLFSPLMCSFLLHINTFHFQFF